MTLREYGATAKNQILLIKRGPDGKERRWVYPPTKEDWDREVEPAGPQRFCGMDWEGVRIKEA